VGSPLERMFQSGDGGIMDFREMTASLPTPCYVVDESLIIRNLEILKNVMSNTGCRILLAQKAFSMYSIYPLIGEYLCGTTASGLYEAKLGYEEMGEKLGRETHVFSPAYKESEFDEIVKICDHIVFNSFSQLRKYADRAKAAGKSIGIRINPECSTQEGHAIYDPCALGSRLGTTKENFSNPENKELIKMLDGIHFHTLCEQDSDDLVKTVEALEEKFGKWLPDMKWINFGGGHHITKPGYDIERLEKCITDIKKKYDVTVYLEPGEAIALNAGFFITTVLETLKNGIDIAILDCSAACHMPDVLEMPYRPPLKGAGEPNEKKYTYRLGGMTCLAGDIIGEYSFDEPLKEGDRLVFEDMAIYSMVKNNTFNGMQLPSIILKKINGDCEVVREFGYEDFKMRL